jgi:two-component system, OmpR family, phosphate regulon sensor histidine kinase PhoR
MVANQKENILIVISDAQINYLLERVLKSTGFQVVICSDAAAAQKELDAASPALLVLGERLSDAEGLDFAATVLRKYPAVPIVLFVKNDQPDLLKSALRLGISDYLCLPLKADDILKSVQNSLVKARLRKEWVLLEARRATSNLQKRLDELEALTRLARSITGTLDLDSVLTSVVDAAVELTGSEEGSLLLLDMATGELYMRAARNFQEDFVRKFRLPIQDTLAGTVLRTGQPVILDEKTPQKIKTAYLVHSLAYVPMQSKGQVIGVLGVDNRMDRKPLQERDSKLLAALAEFAVIAIENSGLYTSISQERNKLDTILTNIQDGVIVIDQDSRLVFANRIVQEAMGWVDQTITGRPYRELLSHPDLLQLVNGAGGTHNDRTEVTLEDGRVFSALLSPIPEVGLVVTLHDITNLKKLDRIKSDFVSTVSHDLRSPLTAILGYIELIDRVGPVTDLQHDFIHRVQISVHNITSLVDDLLNLGRIEAGFDTHKEIVQFDQLIRYTVDNFRKQAEDKSQNLVLELPDSLPTLLANPVQMRQMIENLIDNAIKYTLSGGKITIRAVVAQKQMILQVVDTGIGIPTIDLPYIFDKFYRASNSSPEVSGTGLGLAIVKSIVESHSGRIWVESTVGHGTTFTIVLPQLEG